MIDATEYAATVAVVYRIMRKVAFVSLLIAAAFAQTPLDPKFTALAGQLVAAPDAAAREQILASHPDLVAHSLVIAVHRAGNAVYSQNRIEDALRVYGVACDLARRLEDAPGLALCSFDTGFIYARLDRFDLALPKFLECVARATPLGDHDLLARSFNNIALIYHARSQFQDSVAYHRRALAEYEARGDPAGQVSVRANLGDDYKGAGQYGPAAQELQKALDTAQQHGLEKEMSSILLGLSGLYFHLHDMPLAERYAAESLQIKRKLGDAQTIGDAYSQMATVATAMGKTGSARENFEQARKYAEQARDSYTLLMVLYNYGNLLREHGEHAAGIARLQEAAELADKIGRPAMAAHSRVSLAEVAKDEGRFADALAFCGPALEFGRRFNDPLLVTRVGDAMGVSLRALGKAGEAEQAFRESIAAIEWMRDTIAADRETKAGYMEDKAEVYNHLVDLLASEGRSVDALAIAEKAKARVVLDVLRNGSIDLSREMTPEEKRQEAAFRAQLSALPDARSAPKSAAEMEQARAGYRLFKDALYARHPELKLHRLEVEPVTPAGLFANLPEPGAALLEYVVTDKSVILFVLTNGPDGPATRTYTLAAPAGRLKLDVARFREAIGNRDLSFRPLAGTLYRDLIQPAEAQLNGKSTLVIVPDGFLWQLPFQALADARGRYVIEDRTLFYAPSLTVLHETLRMRPDRPAQDSRILALAAATVPGSRREALGLREIYGSAKTTVYLGPEADEEKIRAEASRYSVLHVAAHGVFRDENPMSSYLILAKAGKPEAGKMEARDLMTLDLHAGMVVLSGCETGRGFAGTGEGLLGMSWALLVAGSPATVASQWKVDSASTADLMLEFHRAVHQSGRKAGSLRLAQLALMKKPEFRHPYYWSGFMLVGQGF